MLKKILFIWLLFPSIGFCVPDDPCAGPQMLLAVINRPSFSDSACPVPTKRLLLEGGIQEQRLIGGGSDINAPSLSIRTGLSKDWEAFVNTGNFNHQNILPYSGTTSTWVGIKRRIYYNQNWIITSSASVSPPSGSKTAGSPNPQANIEGIILNNLTDKLSWQFQLGLSSFSDSQIQGGQQFRSINPDFLINYAVIKKLSTYLEFYGQTKTSSDEYAGIVGGIGVIYLFNPKMTVDVAAYQRLRGDFQGFAHFIGAGVTKLF